jgi:ribokinase
MVASLPGQPTGVALILVDANGENQIVVIPGANGAIEAGYVRDCLSRLGPLVGDVVLLCNEVPLHVVREALTCARAAGATTILNPAPATGIDRSDLLPGRHRHAQPQRAGDAPPHRGSPDRPQDGREPGDPVSGAAPPRSRSGRSGRPQGRHRHPGRGRRDGPGARRLGVRRGDAALVPLEPAAQAAPPDAGPGSNGVRVWEVPAERVSTVDSTGAGDAFNGALAAAIAEGRPLAEAVRRAVAAGALATTHVGAREGMPTAVELDEFIATR